VEVPLRKAGLLAEDSSVTLIPILTRMEALLQ
jgi:hypothetical protein